MKSSIINLKPLTLNLKIIISIIKILLDLNYIKTQGKEYYESLTTNFNQVS
jgi:hypothetical protein